MAYKNTTTKPQKAPIPDDQKLENDPTGKPNQLKSDAEAKSDELAENLKKAKSQSRLHNYTEKIGKDAYRITVNISVSGQNSTHTFYCNSECAEAYKRKMNRKQSRRKRILSVEKV